MIDRESDTAGGQSRADTALAAPIGLSLAAAIISAWLVVHVYAVFFFEIEWQSAPLAVLLFLLATWLSVGLFIVAHDCMHGSLVPFRPGVNRAIGRLCLFLYAGFSYDELNRKHHLHHRHSGTGADPDFNDAPPYGFWPWFGVFLLEYFSWRQYLHMSARFLAYVVLLQASVSNVLILWAAPAIVSALQLFLFGTFLPHRPAKAPFADRHRTRSNDYPWLLSLLTCFHFGYHHEHHAHPSVPWWRLPAQRRQAASHRASGLGE
ncbi:MAG: beta-carotene ketolase [Rhizobiales bacterium]|nr:beta-carotene ketolase [Hyphomicrobiales bacterium]